MSYDFEMKFEHRAVETLKAKINALKNINNLLFSPDENYHMEIDIENEQQILFHIPYSFMDSNTIDHSIYLNKIKEISDHLNATVFDLQQEKFIIDSLYITPKIRKLKSTFHGNPFHAMHLKDKRIILHADKQKSTFELDLIKLKITIKDNSTYQRPPYPDFKVLKRFSNENSKYFAIRNWNKKSVRIYLKSAKFESNEDSIIWDNPYHKEIVKCGKVQKLTFNLDGTLFTTSYRSKILKLWNIEENVLIRNFTNFTRTIYEFEKINKNLIFNFSSSGITFFDYNSGTFLLHIYPCDNSWFCFDGSGNYEGDINNDAIYELDYKDNKFSESFCFVPGIGFANYTPSSKWKLSKVKRLPNHQYVDNLIEKTLRSFI